MSKILSLKLQEKVLQESEAILRRRKTSRNAYFNEAIHFYNQLWKRKLLKKALAEGSTLWRPIPLKCWRSSSGCLTSSSGSRQWSQEVARG